ncbi:lipopolysaccharide biosynthesis protein [Kribbella sp. VKM Ac-2566]|uniref:lipopolysaccharide biosynthesis protein n=1 Tax=Kribbella sp. VKM Ac-2566 TaxID=2512218 RepID=UPI00106350DF|nr:polysaccharide biosynthesis C-terminal domain-containing protein [Kribbella sp. VKM Ac-2566]TDX08446.1 O-antigen/teichoic acid export membrane protein [Kribbella sp. VKM Ac-2566]
MIRSTLRSGGPVRTVLANCSARLLAILGLTLATVLVARIGGPAEVGEYALLRMLPGLVGVLCVLGLPGALAFFLAEPRRGLPRLWPTLMAIGGAGAILGTALWVAASPVIAKVFFPDEPPWLIAAAGATVASQLVLTLGKTALQGLEDRRGGDLVIAAEELAFLPCFLVPLAAGIHGIAAVVVGLGLADLVVAVDAWRRVSRRLGWRRLGLAGGAFGWWGRPDRQLGRRVASYGLRGQVGGLITLLNLRLDVAILGAMAGPAVLGGYAVASKYAELLRLPGTALTWVFYPRLAKIDQAEAARVARRMVGPALIGIAAAAIPVALLASPVLRILYGASFGPAVTPARVLVAGMVLAGASGVASAYLYGRGTPGLNSLVLGVGLAITVVLDISLIPRFGALGAAVASTAAYLSTDALLIGLLLRLSRPPAQGRASVAIGEVTP